MPDGEQILPGVVIVGPSAGDTTELPVVALLRDLRPWA